MTASRAARRRASNSIASVLESEQSIAGQEAWKRRAFGYAPHFSRAMARLDNSATKELDNAGIEPALRELVRIRASQINGCAYCIDMHTKDARAGGESEQRLYGLSAWPETPYFTDRERAALAFTEKVTLVAVDHVPADAYDELAAQFFADEIAALTSLIVTINAWNALSVSTRAWRPGSYEPEGG